MDHIKHKYTYNTIFLKFVFFISHKMQTFISLSKSKASTGTLYFQLGKNAVLSYLINKKTYVYFWPFGAHRYIM